MSLVTKTYIVSGIILAIIVIVGVYSQIVRNRRIKKYNEAFSNIDEVSFQKYAKFYGEFYPHEEEFDFKIRRINSLINEMGERDIKKIASMSFCEIPECVIKIRYLKNKRLIGDFYIDTVNLKLLDCTEEDLILLGKYKPFIYGEHSQIEDFVYKLDNSQHLGIEELKKQALEDLIYLDKKGLLNGVIIDEIDGGIKYYSIEKRKTVYDKETVHCPNCGALNDVELADKTRCSYCNSIILGSKYEESQKES